jgi:hypothetical protein
MLLWADQNPYNYKNIKSELYSMQIKTKSNRMPEETEKTCRLSEINLTALQMNNIPHRTRGQQRK